MRNKSTSILKNWIYFVRVLFFMQKMYDISFPREKKRRKRPIAWNANMFGFLYTKMNINTTNQFHEVIWSFKIIMIKIRIYLLINFFVKNVVFVTKCHVNTIQDDITEKNFSYPVESHCMYMYFHYSIHPKAQSISQSTNRSINSAKT